MGVDLSKIQTDTLPDKIDPQQTRLSTSIKQAMATTPQQAARVSSLTAQSGLPRPVVQSDPDAIESKLQLDKIDLKGMGARSPNTAGFLVDLDNAAIARNDIALLEQTEAVIRGFGAGAVGGIGSTIEGTGRTMQAGMRLTSNALTQAVGLPAGFDLGLLSPQAQTFGAFANLFRRAGSATKEVAEETIAAPEEAQTFASDVSTGLGQMLGQILTLVAAPQAAVPSLFAQGVDIQGEKQEATGTEGETFAGDVALLGGGAVTAVSEKLGLDFILRKIPDAMKDTIKGKITDLFVSGGSEAVQEMVEGIVQNSIEKYTTNPEADVLEGITEEGAVAGTVGTIMRALVMMAIPGKIKAVATDAEQKQNQYDAEQVSIDALNTAAENTEMRTLDPERYKQFIADNDGEKNTHVYFDRDKVAAYLSEKQVYGDKALQILSDAIKESDITGANVAIPVSDFAAYIAATPHFTALRENMSMSAETFTPADHAKAQAEVKKFTDELMNRANENVTQYVEAQELFDNVKQQLIDTGMINPQNADTMSKIVPAWATVYARTNGITLQEAFNNLKIEGPQTGAMDRLSDEARAINSKITLTDMVKIADTGEEVEVTMTAQEALDDMDARFDVAKQLVACTRGRTP